MRGDNVRGGDAAATVETVTIMGHGMPIPGTEERGDLIVHLAVRSTPGELAHVSALCASTAALCMMGNTCRRVVPTVLSGVASGAAFVTSVALEFISDEVLGRARPEAQAERERARTSRRLARHQRQHTRQRCRTKQQADEVLRKLARRWVGAWRWAFDRL